MVARSGRTALACRKNIRRLHGAGRRTENSGIATFRRKIEVLGCCGRIAQGLENCKVRRN
jgi:hypothetical protein